MLVAHCQMRQRTSSSERIVQLTRVGEASAPEPSVEVGAMPTEVGTPATGVVEVSLWDVSVLRRWTRRVRGIRFRTVDKRNNKVPRRSGRDDANAGASSDNAGPSSYVFSIVIAARSRQRPTGDREDECAIWVCASATGIRVRHPQAASAERS